MPVLKTEVPRFERNETMTERMEAVLSYLQNLQDSLNFVLQTTQTKAAAAEQLGDFLKIEKDVQALRVSVTDETGELLARIELTALGLASEVSRATEEEGTLSSQITQTANNILLKASSTDEENGTEIVGLINLSSYTATINADRINLVGEVEVSGSGSNARVLISDGTITASKIDNGAVTTTKIAGGAVTTNELAANAVTTAKLATGAVTANEIAAGAVTAGKISVTDLYALNAKIGGFTIGQTSIHNLMESLADTTHDGVYIGTDGIALGKGAFKVTKEGALTANGSLTTISANTYYKTVVNGGKVDFYYTGDYAGDIKGVASAHTPNGKGIQITGDDVVAILSDHVSIVSDEVKINNRAAVTGQVLWTNYDPNNSFSAQEVSITGLSNWDIITIEFRFSYQSQLAYYSSVQAKYVAGRIMQLSMTGYDLSSGICGVCRRATLAANKITFTTGCIADGSGAIESTNYAIPTRVIGLKFEA